MSSEIKAAINELMMANYGGYSDRAWLKSGTLRIRPYRCGDITKLVIYDTEKNEFDVFDYNKTLILKGK